MPLLTELLPFNSGSETLQAYLARPEGDGPFPGVVVIHEAYGLNHDIKDICRRFAGEGYAALGVDLFYKRSQVVCMFRFFGGMMFNSLNHPGIRDLKAALDYFAKQPFVDSQRIGAVGYCMGGAFAMAWAATDNRLRAIAPYYGMNPKPLAAVYRLCPVVGSYPIGDFSEAEGHKLDAALEGYNIPHDIKFYSASKHSFFNATSRNYNATAAQDSWERVLAFFKEHVG